MISTGSQGFASRKPDKTATAHQCQRHIRGIAIQKESLAARCASAEVETSPAVAVAPILAEAVDPSPVVADRGWSVVAEAILHQPAVGPVALGEVVVAAWLLAVAR
ncbi:MAG: hypothetical protein CMA08_04745, partial [Euryarchaeota archaeon]|nr:hypothetical protein [Euryarchaeota archaeon]